MIESSAAPLPSESALRGAFAADVGAYLQRSPRQLPSRYFYDALGSALFEAICRLPWYRITPAETALLSRHARAILQALDRPLSLAELGCGSGEKLAALAGAAGEPFTTVQLVDISPAARDAARDRLTAIGIRSIVTHHATYVDGLARIARERPREGALVLLFLGSNIGNFDPTVAHDLLVRIRLSLRAGDSLLIGHDLIKPERELLLAYDDPLQVTAAFNRNLLRRINDELGGDFALEGFAHRAVWNGAESRVEMHLVSLTRQHVRIPAASCEITFEAGEHIWTESSHKYTSAQALEEGIAAGFVRGEQWIDAEAGFALTRLCL